MNFKARRTLEKLEPCSAPMGCCGDPSSSWQVCRGSVLRAPGKQSCRQVWAQAARSGPKLQGLGQGKSRSIPRFLTSEVSSSLGTTECFGHWDRLKNPLSWIGSWGKLVGVG